MANINDLFPGRYLKPHELQGRDVTVTITHVALEEMGRTRDVVPVAYFVGKTKGLKLNKTMATTIATIAQSFDTAQWTGVQVCLYATSAEFAKQSFAVVRVKAPAAATGPRRMGGAA